MNSFKDFSSKQWIKLGEFNVTPFLIIILILLQSLPPKSVSLTLSTSSSSLITYVQSLQFVRPSRRLYRPHDSSACWSPALNPHYFSILFPYFVTKTIFLSGTVLNSHTWGLWKLWWWYDCIVSPCIPIAFLKDRQHDGWFFFAWDGHLLLHPLSTPCVPEAFCKRVVVDLQLRHLLVLICCHRYELALLQISPFFSLSLDIFYRTIIWAFGKTWVGLPWRRMSWRWSREAEGCRSPSPGGTVAGTCASSSGSSETGGFRQNQLPQSSASHKFCRFCIDLGEKLWLESCNWENWLLWKKVGPR